MQLHFDSLSVMHLILDSGTYYSLIVVPLVLLPSVSLTECKEHDRNLYTSAHEVSQVHILLNEPLHTSSA